VIDRWRKFPQPHDPNRTEPLVSPNFTPPSEDPYYVNKWTKFREENATGAWFERQRNDRQHSESGVVEAAPDRGDVLRPANGDHREDRVKRPHRKAAARSSDGA
jgi:hypothetical protein